MAMISAKLTNALSRQIFQPSFREKADTEHWDWRKIATVRNSKAATEQEFPTTGMGSAVATGELEPTYYGEFHELDKMTWTHTKYTLGSMISQEAMEDNQNLPELMGELGERIGEGQSYIVDYTVAQIFNRAFSSTYPVYDSGVALCGTHTLKKDGVQTVSNYATTASSISFTTIWAAINYFNYGMYTHEYLPTTDTAKYLLYHPSQTRVVRKVLEAQGQPDTADNNPNTLLKYGLVPIPCRFLTSTYWFLLGSKFPKDLIFYWRIQKETKEEPDFDRDAMKIKTRQRFSVKMREWMHIYGNAGA